ncbi:MAG TPA: MBL fold metallo-hydrolase [Candidatus Binatia bacterium]|nr:MBL fold metallo-hydrolase [Candidatus Binatia bacterium]
MKTKLVMILAAGLSLLFVHVLSAQDLGPQIKKIKDGIYVYVGKEFNSNAGIVLTQDGVVLIDSGHNPTDSRAILDAVKKLTSLPVRFLIDTEPHGDHTTGHFVFSPPAVIIAHEGATDSMKKAYSPARNEKLMAGSPEMRAAFDGFRMITPHMEYRQKMTLNLGERTFELMYLKGVHSEADTAVWLPKERVLFSASAVVVNQYNILRPFVTIPDILAAAKMMKALNPEFVVPGHGDPGTAKILDDMERYYNLLMERVGAMVKDGKSLDDIKKELKMPETDDWAGKDRFPNNIEAAYRAVKGS